ncbi:MAG TPA: extracellular solute-binding protein [Candidatus Dormibacteraeota bacterium]|jgi:multiple sugar transport system substrate-binding protein
MIAFRRSLGATTMVALASLLVMACGSGTNTGNTTTVGYSASQPKVKVSFWYMPNGSDPNAYVKSEIDAFNAAHPNIEVDGTLVDWGDAFSKISTALTSGVGPDVTQLGTTWVGAFSKTGGLHAFSQAEIDGLGGKSAFVPAAWSSSGLTGSGQTTAIPWFIDTRAIYYRADVLKSLNIDPSTAFATWDSFDQTLSKIQASGKIQAFGIPGKNAYDVVHNFAPWIWDAGGDYVNANGTRSTISSDASVDGVYQYTTLASKYVDRAVLGKANNEVEALFAAGKFAVTTDPPTLAQQLQTPASSSGYAESVAAKAGFGTAPFPAGPKDHKVFFGGSNLAVLKSSKQEAAAYEWVRWMTNQAQPTYVPKVGLFPARVSAASAPVFANNPYDTAFKDQLQFGKSYPMIAAWGPIETALVKDFGTLWDQVAQSNGPVSRNVVKDDMTKAGQDIDAAIQQSQ